MKQTRFLSLIVAGALMLTLGACSSKTDEKPATTASAEASTSSDATEAASQEAAPASDAAAPASDAAAPASDATATEAGASQGTANYIGDFIASDLNGELVKPDSFANYDLTLLNVFATWCQPCVAEMPELQSVSQKMKDQSVQVVGIVVDAGLAGDIEESMIPTVEELLTKTGVTYPVMVPDEVLALGVLRNVDAIPMTFFVDRNGNIVGETYLGARNEAQWMQVIEQEKAKVSAQ